MANGVPPIRKVKKSWPVAEIVVRPPDWKIENCGELLFWVVWAKVVGIAKAAVGVSIKPAAMPSTASGRARML